jgi:transcriptional regulator with GAF, ATPase, and Fis domain
VQRETVKDDASSSESATMAPGVVIVFSGTSPCFRVLPLHNGALDLGRDDLASLHIADNRVSRDHLRLRFANGLWTIADRGSTNGVYLDAVKIDGAPSTSNPRVIRIGKTLIVPLPDVTPYATHGLSVTPERIMGPGLRVALDRIAAIRRANQNVLITGGSGSGKEHAARAFHEAGSSGSKTERPFVAVNSATIPLGLAERILFGTKRGAYSGADADAKGLVQAAHGGTLFLDEIGDIEASVQAKLLRVIETKEVLPMGGLQPIPVEFSLCAATHKDLRVEVAAGRFREDLYFRIGQPQIRLPSLTERPEEIPWLIQRALETVNANSLPEAEFVETCLLRSWPGNVRELLAEVRGAAIAALGEKFVSARHLLNTAGTTMQSPSQNAVVSTAEDDHPITNALREAGGNVSQASSLLGMTRAKVRRFIEKTSLDVNTLKKK